MSPASEDCLLLCFCSQNGHKELVCQCEEHQGPTAACGSDSVLHYTSVFSDARKKKKKKKSCSQYVVKVFSSASAGFLHSWRFYLGMTHFPLLYQNAPFLGGGGEEGNCSQNTQKSLIIALFLHCFFFTSIFIGVCFTNKSN